MFFLKRREKNEEKKEYLFSKKLRGGLEEFGEMSVTEIMQSEDFFIKLGEIAGAPSNEIEDILKKTQKKKEEK